jgi:glycosyltransferase involved in cell wall biosynthesis
MNENAIDVICPVYNAENTISRCIDSVLAQRHQNWKLILVDDGSTDKSAQIIRKYVNDYPDKIYYFYQEYKPFHYQTYI